MSRSSIEQLDENGWARLLGTNTEEIQELCGPQLQEYDFRYEILEGDSFESTLLTVIRTMDEFSLSVSGRNRKNDWEAGWAENLDSFISGDYRLDKLVPRYMHKYGVRRLFGRFVRPLSHDFEVNFYTIYRHYLFKKYLSDFNPIFEFGCGTGYNLVILANLFPDKKLIGLDWAESSNRLVDAIAARYNFNMESRRFNFFEPDFGLDVPPGSAFLTLNSLEQIGNESDAFLDFAIAKRPDLCINSEPFIEMYDDNMLMDYLATRYHRQRNYLNGYYRSLQNLEKKGEIIINETQRVASGNLFHEGYSIVVWRNRNEEK